MNTQGKEGSREKRKISRREDNRTTSATLLRTPSIRIQEAINVHSLEEADVFVINPSLRKAVVRYEQQPRIDEFLCPQTLASSHAKNLTSRRRPTVLESRPRNVASAAHDSRPLEWAVLRLPSKFVVR